MAKIIDTLTGVVYVRTPEGSVTALRAGDEIPAGVSMGAHLVEGGEPVSAEEAEQVTDETEEAEQVTDETEEAEQVTDETEEVNQNAKTGRTRRRSTANKS